MLNESKTEKIISAQDIFTEHAKSTNSRVYAIPFNFDFTKKNYRVNIETVLNHNCHLLLSQLKAYRFRSCIDLQCSINKTTKRLKIEDCVLDETIIKMELKNDKGIEPYLKSYCNSVINGYRYDGLLLIYCQGSILFVLDVIPFRYQFRSIPTGNDLHPFEVIAIDNGIEFPIELPFVNYTIINTFERMKFKNGISIHKKGSYLQYDITLLNIENGISNVYNSAVYNAIISGKTEIDGIHINRVYQTDTRDIRFTRVTLANDVMYHRQVCGNDAAPVFQGYFELQIQMKRLMPFNVIMITENISPFVTKVLGFRYIDNSTQDCEVLCTSVPFMICNVGDVCGLKK